MSMKKQVEPRSGMQCELCGSKEGLSIYNLPPDNGPNAATSLMICEKCNKQIEKKEELDTAHWSLLEQSIWSEVPAVQIVSWRMLNRLRSSSWATDLLDMMYLSEDDLVWAKATGDHESDGSVALHKDSNGALLHDGDTVLVTKSLDVKGSSLTAKIGTVVKNIRLVQDNVDQIEGKVEGQQIVILTKYLRKQN